MSTRTDRERERRRRIIADAVLCAVATAVADAGPTRPNDIIDALATCTAMIVAALSDGDDAAIASACMANAERLARVIASFREDRGRLVEVLAEYGIDYVAMN
jgi:hypothetical protein